MSTYVKDYECIVRELRTDAVVSVSSGFGDPLAPPVVVSALWDTGAYGSVINQKVVDALGLMPIDHHRACGVNGWYDTPVYVIDLQLPNNIVIKDVPVSLGGMVAADILIGMDVISLGDLNLTNKGSTVFAIRTPSEGSNPIA